jgi:O-acetyl-ADP-ribose deacetylase (regulator of RNase III)
MPFRLVRDDITRMSVDVIINVTNNQLYGSGQLDDEIHRAAGPMLLKDCQAVGFCETGEAKITRSYKLDCDYVIHAVKPTGESNEKTKELLRNCYRNAFLLAKKYKLETVAISLVTSEVLGYKEEDAYEIAIEEIKEFLVENDMLINLVINDKDSVKVPEEMVSYLDPYISRIYSQQEMLAMTKFREAAEEEVVDEKVELEDGLKEAFSEKLFRMFEEKGMTDEEICYKGNFDRYILKKMRKDKYSHPRKKYHHCNGCCT